MKKTIEYAGIAAATLLAVSPVATQVLKESSTVVQAATTTPSDAEKTAMDNLAKSLKSTSYGTDSSDVKTSFPALLSSDKSDFAEQSFGSGLPNGVNSATFITGPLFSSLNGSTLTDADKSALKNPNITVLNQVIGSDGNPMDVSNWVSSADFTKAISAVRNVNDYGGILKLRATIKYNGETYGSPIDYSLTNNNMVSSNVDEVNDAVASFKKNLDDNGTIVLQDNDYGVTSDMTDGSYARFNYPGQRVFYGDKDQSSIGYLIQNKSVLSKALANMQSVQDAFKNNNINLVVKVKDSNGDEVTSTSGLSNIDSKKTPFKLDFSFQYPDGKGNMQTIDNGSEVSFEPKKTTNSVNGTYDDTPVHVKDGSKVRDVNFGNLTLNADDKNYTVKVNSYGSLYSSANDAWNSLAFAEGDPKAPNPVDVGDTFDASKGTKYYQLVSGDVPTELNDFMNKWTNDSNWSSNGNSVNYKLSINGQEVPLNLNADGTWVLADAPVKVWASLQGIVYIREIDVDKSDSGSNNNNNSNNSSNVQSISGVATTHNDKNSYSLYNDDNKKVDNRALIKKSSWKVDGVRTLDGVKQYRVSSHEWVNADDVDFVENGEITEGLSVQKLDTPKQINLATRHNHYGLQNSKREVSMTRALAGGTSWMVDKVGRDSHGGIYYGVSTNEFVKAGDGVTVVK